MVSTKALKSALTAALKEVCGSVCFGRGNVVYPRIAADLKQVGSDSVISQYMLYIDIYARRDRADEADDIADGAARALDRGIYAAEGIVITAAAISGYARVADTAEDIIHITASYALRACGKD